MIPGHILRDSDLVCLSWDRGIRAFQSTYDTGIYNEKSIFGPCLILGTELLKPLGFPMWNFLLLFITGSFQSHLSFCYWGDFWKAPRVESAVKAIMWLEVWRFLPHSWPLKFRELLGCWKHEVAGRVAFPERPWKLCTSSPYLALYISSIGFFSPEF